jgi:hypothetical protein
MKKNTIAVKPYSLTEMSKMYDVCTRTMKKWLLPFEGQIGKKQGRYFTIAQVTMILDKLGLPTEIAL